MSEPRLAGLFLGNYNKVFGGFKKIKFKLLTRAPPMFVRPVKSNILEKFELPSPSERQCSTTSTFFHIYSIVKAKGSNCCGSSL